MNSSEDEIALLLENMLYLHMESESEEQSDLPSLEEQLQLQMALHESFSETTSGSDSQPQLESQVADSNPLRYTNEKEDTVQLRATKEGSEESPVEHDNVTQDAPNEAKEGEQLGGHTTCHPWYKNMIKYFMDKIPVVNDSTEIPSDDSVKLSNLTAIQTNLNTNEDTEEQDVAVEELQEPLVEREEPLKADICFQQVDEPEEDTLWDQLYKRSLTELLDELKSYNCETDSLVDKGMIVDTLIAVRETLNEPPPPFILECEIKQVAADYIPLIEIPSENFITALDATSLRQLMLTHPKNCGVPLSHNMLVYRVKQRWKEYKGENVSETSDEPVQPPKCFKCKIRDPDWLFIPCGHCLYCVNCGKACKTCNCHQNVTEAFQIFRV